MLPACQFENKNSDHWGKIRYCQLVSEKSFMEKMSQANNNYPLVKLELDNSILDNGLAEPRGVEISKCNQEHSAANLNRVDYQNNLNHIHTMM